MNPIQLTENLKHALISYLLTTFDVNRDGKNQELQREIRNAFEAEKALINGPFLELSLPYVRGKSISELVNDGVLSSKLLEIANPPIPTEALLYLHQQRAIERLVSGHSVIVSSGTGSGKTESFLIPILDDLLRNPSNDVRVVIIYPLNALVNDQLERLRKLLEGTRVTFGRYTSELPQTTKDWQRSNGDADVPEFEVISREQIHSSEKIPNILITNYAMLELLLLRPDDTPLFRNPDSWKFIVLDEAHTYSGAKGIEVAYLIRRLKQRLQKSTGEIQCIGTSATLTDSVDEARQFAKTLFGEQFKSEDIIFGQEQEPATVSPAETFRPNFLAYLDTTLEDLLDQVRKAEIAPAALHLRMLELGLTLNAKQIEVTDVGALLHQTLNANYHLNKLQNIMLEQKDYPLTIEEAAEWVFGDEQASHRDKIRALYRLVELGGHARLDSISPALLPARYHVFARSPQGIWACLNPSCPARPEGHQPVWSKIFSSPLLKCTECSCAVYPVYVCRTCGQAYIRTLKYEKDPKNYTDIAKAEEAKARYYVWDKPEFNEAFNDGEDDDESSTIAASSGLPTLGSAVHLCLNDDCRQTSRCQCAEPRKTTLYPIEKTTSKRGGTSTAAVSELKTCYRCGNEGRFDSEIATAVQIAGMTPLSALTMELYRNLPTSTDRAIADKPGEGRKLLTFYDSRQGAARYAAFLQDVFNQDLYRFLTVHAIRELKKDRNTISLEDLVEESARIGWDDLKVFQNSLDEESNEWMENPDDRRLRSRAWSQLDESTQRKVKDFTRVRILAEITTRKKDRQSLESLGLMTVGYFGRNPDLSKLSDAIRLSQRQTIYLVNVLLDTLRSAKAIKLPKGIDEKHKAFGAHQGNPRVVRGGTGNPNRSEVPWVGATKRHTRYRIVEAVLSTAGLASDEGAVKKCLIDIWNWLIDDEDGILIESADGSYQVPSKLYFDAPEDNWCRCTRCQRISHDVAGMPCLAPGCDGKYVLLNQQDHLDNNYYYHVFKKGMIPMRVEEHTAQLEPEKGREYQEDFKSGKINILSCSTTFEMGIDLGDLQAVVMNNVPPSVSNYRQRAGRAGRRIGGTAFIVTWAQERPHDQIYFNAPPDIVRGHVRIPRITLKNNEIRRRHTNALLLSHFLRYLKSHGRSDLRQVSSFFDPQTPDGRHFDTYEDWFLSNKSDLVQAIVQYQDLVELHRSEGINAIDQFRTDLSDAEGKYRAANEYYIQRQTELMQKYITSTGPERNSVHNEVSNIESLLRRLKSDDLIEALSNRGVLPSYSFPLYTVEMDIRTNGANPRLRLQRDLSRAITEYAPGSEVVADKRIWKSAGIRILKDAPQVFYYRLCKNCNNIRMEDIAEKLVTQRACEICREDYSTGPTSYLVPDGFFTTGDQESGKLAGQYIKREFVQRTVGLRIPSINSMASTGEFVQRSLHSDGSMIYLNLGRSSLGYKLCLRCGRHVTSKEGKCFNTLCEGRAAETIHLGHRVRTDTLLITFNPLPDMVIPNRLDLEFWHTLQTALVLGASRALQIERNDIGGTLFPMQFRSEWQRGIVLYDAVPGGAGYVRDIDNNFAAVVDAALEVVDCSSCNEDTSCTRCLREYGNQDIYSYLKRGKVIRFLQSLSSYLNAKEDPLGVRLLGSNDRVAALRNHISSARHSVHLAVAKLEIDLDSSDPLSWLDLFSSVSRRGVDVKLLVQALPQSNTHDRADLILLKYLSVMLELQAKGSFELRQSDVIPEWHLIVDGQAQEGFAQALRFKWTPPALSSSLRDISVPAIETTLLKEGVRASIDSFATVFQRAQSISASDLAIQAKTKVHLIKGTSRAHSERDIPAISALFESPVIEMKIIDPYLLDRERIVNRLGTYVQMASETGALKRVSIDTRDAKMEGKDRTHQHSAFDELKRHFPNVEIVDKKRTDRSLHDRSLEIMYADGSKATVYIGRGLDFIRPDGSVQATYLVVDKTR